MVMIAKLHEEIIDCRRCEEVGCIPYAAPVVCDPIASQIMLIGQAPGQVELVERRPFQGRAGRELFRWLESIGIAEDQFRGHVYMTSITKCFPGKAKTGAGDRRPSSREIGLCRPWLERQLGLLQPRVVLLVGGLAIERYLRGIPLTELIGRTFEIGGVTYIPLPHPSGASRWLNSAENRALLREALQHVREAWETHVAGARAMAAAG